MGSTSAFTVAAGCETFGLTNTIINSWYLGENLSDQINTLKKLRDKLDKTISERQACGDDAIDLLNLREQEPHDIDLLNKEYTDLKRGAGGLNWQEVLCGVLGAGALALPEP